MEQGEQHGIERDVPPPWLGALVVQSTEALVAFDAQLFIVYANAAADELLRMPPGGLVGRNALDFVHGDDLDRAATNISAVGIGARPRAGLLRLNLGDGTTQALEITPMSITIEDPPGTTQVLTVAEIRDTALADAHWNFLTSLSGGAPFLDVVERLANGLSIGVDGPFSVAFDEAGRRVSVGPVPAALAGVTAEGTIDDTPGTPWHEALSTGEPVVQLVADLPSPFRALAASIGAAACVAVPVTDPGQRAPALIVQWPPFEPMAQVIKEAIVHRPRYAVELALERRHVQRRLEHLALHDSLTGLANRAQLFEVVGSLCAGTQPFAVCYIDLDGFKPVNDTLGHLAGDEVLGICATRLQHVARGDAVVARMGGDEFVVACPGVRDTDELGAIAERFVAALSEPLVVGEHELAISASAGCSLGSPGDQADAVVAAADVALYEAKRAGRNTWRFAPATSS
jgi:diguanylate cyclase (GGDEF)-like protein